MTQLYTLTIKLRDAYGASETQAIIYGNVTKERADELTAAYRRSSTDRITELDLQPITEIPAAESRKVIGKVAFTTNGMANASVDLLFHPDGTITWEIPKDQRDSPWPIPFDTRFPRYFVGKDCSPAAVRPEHPKAFPSGEV